MKIMYLVHLKEGGKPPKSVTHTQQTTTQEIKLAFKLLKIDWVGREGTINQILLRVAEYSKNRLLMECSLKTA